MERVPEKVGANLHRPRLNCDFKKKTQLLTRADTSRQFDVQSAVGFVSSPDDPTDDEISYGDICAVLSAHFVSYKIEIAERFRFYQQKQQPGEYVATFIAALRNLSKDCAFGAFLQQALRDAFVIGLLNPKFQTALLADKNLTLDSALSLATSMEAAALQTRELRQTNQSNIHAFPQSSSGCWRCGERHRPDTCKYKDLECFNCKKKGHMAAKCREKSDGKAGGEGKLRRRQRHKKKWEVKFQGEVGESFDSDLGLYHLPDGVASGAARS